MKNLVIIALAGVIAVGGILHVVAIGQTEVRGLARVEVTVWEHVEDGRIYLSTRQQGGVWTTHDQTPVDLTVPSESGAFWQGRPIAIDVPVAFTVGVVPVAPPDYGEWEQYDDLYLFVLKGELLPEVWRPRDAPPPRLVLGCDDDGAFAWFMTTGMFGVPGPHEEAPPPTHVSYFLGPVWADDEDGWMGNGAPSSIITAPASFVRHLRQYEDRKLSITAHHGTSTESNYEAEFEIDGAEDVLDALPCWSQPSELWRAKRDLIGTAGLE